MTVQLRNRFWFVVLSTICKFIFAVTFIASGVLKATDPWGTVLTIENYFAAYDIVAPDSFVAIASVVLSASEVLLGVMLLFNIFIRITSVMSVVVMLFFTTLTLLDATIVPVESCGCLGEMIPLTPWQSFAKNMVLLPMSLCIWYYHRQERVCEMWRSDLMFTLLFSALTYGASWYILLHPINGMDNSAYKVGVNISQEIGAESETQQQEEVVLVYRNLHTGEVREFELEDKAWQDETQWEWVDTRVKTGSTIMPIMSEFYIFDEDKVNRTDELLALPKLYMLFVAKPDYDDEVRNRFAAVEQFASVNGGVVVYISSEKPSLFEGLSYPCYNMDSKLMQTILPADYGLLVLENGEVAEKYSYRDIPY